MSKPLLGGGAAAVALLSASLLFYAQPSVAETLAGASQEIQQKKVEPDGKTPAAELSTAADELAEAGGTINDREIPAATGLVTPPAIDKSRQEVEETSPSIQFTATAYSLRGRTASGRAASRGLIAADSRVLPIGTRVRLEAGQYSGEYVVADTGGSVRGRKIDIWVPNAGEAVRFGRRPVKLTVLTRTRPRATSPRGRK